MAFVLIHSWPLVSCSSDYHDKIPGKSNLKAGRGGSRVYVALRLEGITCQGKNSGGCMR